MRLKDGPSLEEKLYRQNILGNEERSALPSIILCLVAALLLGLFVRFNMQINTIRSYGNGNPYNCKSCKELGRACRNHRGFDRDEALHDKVYKFVANYEYELNILIDESTEKDDESRSTEEVVTGDSTKKTSEARSIGETMNDESTEEISTKENKEDSLYAMYGYGKSYNTECDFCIENETECHSCRFDRLYIEEIYKNIVTDDYFKSRLCDDCWKKEKIDCDRCREMATDLIIARIRNGGAEK